MESGHKTEFWNMNELGHWDDRPCNSRGYHFICARTFQGSSSNDEPPHSGSSKVEPGRDHADKHGATILDDHTTSHHKGSRCVSDTWVTVISNSSHFHAVSMLSCRVARAGLHCEPHILYTQQTDVSVQPTNQGAYFAMWFAGFLCNRLPTTAAFACCCLMRYSEHSQSVNRLLTSSVSGVQHGCDRGRVSAGGRERGGDGCVWMPLVPQTAADSRRWPEDRGRARCGPDRLPAVSRHSCA
eukprot:3936071-Rhodomonas_salina.2